MNYITRLFILILIGCNNQTTTENSGIDTSKLFNPNPGSIKEGEMENIYKRNIVLTQPDYSINFNDQVHKFSYLFRVGEFIKSNKEEVMRNKFYLIADSNTSFERINSIINILVENNITDYKVINLSRE